MGREVGGGSGWGTHVNPWLIHVNVWQKPLQYCKIISLLLIKINGKKKKKLWKIIKEVEIPDNFTYLLRNLDVGQEATVRTGHGTMDWFIIGKGV